MSGKLPSKSQSCSPPLDVSVMSESFTSVIKSLCERHMTTIVVGFIDKLTQKGYDEKELLSVWNSVAPEYVIELTASTKKKAEPSTVSGKICCFHFVRANKDCDREVSIKSVTGNYCSRHLKEETKPEGSRASSPSASVSKNKCEYEFKQGENEGKQCTSNVSDKSKTGRFCSKHAKSQEAEKSPKKEKSKSSKSNSSKKDEQSDFSPTFVPRLNKDLRIYVDADSGFIFEKSSDKKIYAKLVDGKITPLGPRDKELLTSMNYLFDTAILTKLHPDLKDEDDEVSDDQEKDEDDQDKEDDE